MQLRIQIKAYISTDQGE